MSDSTSPSDTKFYPELPHPPIACTTQSKWISSPSGGHVKYVSLFISYELGHIAKSPEWRNQLLSRIFEEVMTSLESATPDIYPDTTTG